ncbi:hypothetical protein C0989_005065 [Termitomyces sp. Mn162]|nr:hypothetical protein C0989_005065 [Termitomyces sp. Mn162]
MNALFPTSTPSSHPSPAFDEAVFKRKQEEFSQQQQEKFRKEQLRFEETRQRTESPEQVLSTLERHEYQWNILISSATSLHWGSIPWPMFFPPQSPEDITLSTVTTYLQSPLLPDRERAKPLRDRLQEMIKKWHPDWFEAKYLPRIIGVDRERETWQREQELKYSEEGLRQMEKELIKREKELRKREEEFSEKEEFRKKEEFQRRGREIEAMFQKNKEESGKEGGRFEKEFDRRRQEWRDTTMKEQEFQDRERELKAREDVMKARESELRAREGVMKAREAKSETLATIAREMAIHAVLADARYHRILVQCVGNDAQTILDVFQLLLDSRTFPDRAKLIVAMQRLSTRTELYPLRYFLNGPVKLSSDYPVDSGRFAEIYKATVHGKPTCLKVVRAYGDLVQRMAKVYAREAILWCQLCHPNVLPFYGLHLFRSQIAFVAPWAENSNITKYLQQGPSALNRVLLCMDTSAGLEYLHANGVVHGNLKALNILVDGSGRACISDFGLAGLTDESIIRWATQSSATSKGGASRWQAPELHDLELTAPNTKESDVFAWASTCYEIFTDKWPFFEVSEIAASIKIMRGNLPTRPPAKDLSWSERGLTEQIWDLLVDCWRKKPSERPDITTVISRLNHARPSEDPRPRPQWETGVAMQVRNVQETITRGKQTSLEDLDPILLRIMGDTRCEVVHSEG